MTEENSTVPEMYVNNSQITASVYEVMITF